MLEPLKQFYCDECGQVILRPEDGYVEWISIYDKEKEKFISRGFRIVHHPSTSPYKANREGCYKYGDTNGRMDIALNSFLENVNVELMSFLDPGFLHNSSRKDLTGIIDFPEFADFSRRLTVPYYEEARLYFDQISSDEDFNDRIERSLYSEKTLKRIIDKYSK
ncbi:hypothetical protein [uncultured Bacteroides sp.]|uniref:hypothetical protein n=1 Tax=uncultured Bacteroides sp. TaxID=162156 RepID=UPI002AA89116|nr:hypothetical protein [uncultured Bacteroides sp.]